MNRFATTSLVALLATTPVLAAPVVDGTFSAGEWDDLHRGTRDSWINGSNANGGLLRTDRYSTFDSDYLYVAIVADKSYQTTRLNDNGTPSDSTDDFSQTGNAWDYKAFPGVNLYVYSGSSRAGTYGNGDDFIFENGKLRYSRPGPTVWAEDYLTGDANGDYYDGSTLVASYKVIDNVAEAKLSLASLKVAENGYSSLTFGGQTWAYGFTYSVAPAAIPEPTAVGLAAVAGLGLLARRRRA